MMKYLEGISLGIALIEYIVMLRREDGDKEGALVGIGTLIAKAAGAKDEEVGLLVGEFKRLAAAISALRSA